MPTFDLGDAYYRDLADLLLAVRDARTAFEAARAKAEEWNTFAAAIRRGQRTAAPLPTLIDEARSRSAGWWRRAHARNHSPAEEQTR